MQIYIHRDNQQLGPFTEAEVKAQLASGAISLQDHVWWQGQANWMPLGESPLAATLSSTSPGSAPGALPAMSAAPGVAVAPTTSKLAIWSLVCGCLSIICWPFTSIPAIILGHMGRSDIKKNPALQGGGMALAGMILGYVFTTFIVVYVVFAGIVLMAMGHQVSDVFKTIQSQLNAAELTNSADQSATTPDQTTNASDQTTPAPAMTNSPDQSTNSAPPATNSADSSTNSPPASTNAAPVNQ